MQKQDQMPKIGFGTYGRTGDEGIAAIVRALEVGYRHLDTAQSYDTEREVGEAMRQSGIARDDIWVTTKVATTKLGKGEVVPSLERSLEELGVDQVDLALIHWPSPNGETPLAVYIEQIAEAKAKGLAARIGVSNFPIALLKETEALIGKGEIYTNQFECNPLFQNRKLTEFCDAQGIIVTCYQPIAAGNIGDEPTLARIAAAQAASPEQVALAFELAKGYAVIPTSSKAERIRSNFAAGTLVLSAEEIADIEGIPGVKRRINPEWGPDWD